MPLEWSCSQMLSGLTTGPCECRDLVLHIPTGYYYYYQGYDQGYDPQRSEINVKLGNQKRMETFGERSNKSFNKMADQEFRI